MVSCNQESQSDIDVQVALFSVLNVRYPASAAIMETDASVPVFHVSSRVVTNRSGAEACEETKLFRFHAIQPCSKAAPS